MTRDLFFQKIKDQQKAELPFVAYRHPKSDSLKLVLQNNNEIHQVTQWTDKGFVFAPFRLENKIVLTRADQKFEMRYQTGRPLKMKKKESLKSHGKEEYLLKISAAVHAIKETELEKVVLSRKEEVAISEAETPLNSFLNVLDTYREAFCYWWYHPRVGTWIGATPEKLMSFEKETVKTVALAGTKLNTAESSAKWTAKEIEEQQIVTDYIVQTIQPYSQALKIGETKTVKAGHLLHLSTLVSAQLNKGQKHDLIEELHPTPAVCGLPKQMAKNYLLQNETYDRKFYTGFLGELNMEKDFTVLFVNLRCMEWLKTKVVLYMGGGVTRDSVPEKEWEETRNKSMIMYSVL